MSWLIKGATEFIKLTDTPAAYTGEASKAAVVNSGETALEFVAMPESPVYPVFDDTVIFGPAGKNDNWEDLDCGVGQAIVYLKIVIAVAEAAVAKFRQDGETVTNTAEDLGNAQFIAGVTLAYAMMATDTAGLIEWRYNGAQNVTITRIAYWKGANVTKSLLLDGVSVAPWTELNVGVNRALAILLIVSDDANGQNWHGRLKGDVEETNYGIMYTSPFPADCGGYVLVATDAEGKFEWNCGVAGRDIRIYRVGYILGADFKNNEEIHNGAGPGAAFVDLLTGYVRGFLYLRHKHTVTAGFDNVMFRGNGEASDVKSDTGLVGSAVDLDKICYNFLPLDVDGIVDWEGDAADTIKLDGVALSH